MKLLFTEYLPTLLWGLLGIFLLLVIYIINLIALPFARIPAGKPQAYQLKIKLRAVHIGCPYRDIAEEILGNKPIFFSTQIDAQEPNYLYINKRFLSDLPQELIYPKNIEESLAKDRTVLLKLEARKSLLNGYLPANILGFEILNEKPEFSK